MVGFWKFNVFVGTVGIMLVLGAFYGTAHSFTYTSNDVETLALSASFVVQKNVLNVPLLVFLTGAASILYQLLMTALGLLVGFFGAPARR